MEVFSKAIERQGGTGGVWGFVDGTFRGHCRPEGQDAQELVYSGYKRLHGIQYQAITTPDCLISSLTGPYPGCTNDWAMWKRSGCENAIRTVN